jgi:hypothetical protein
MAETEWLLGRSERWSAADSFWELSKVPVAAVLRALLLLLLGSVLLLLDALMAMGAVQSTQKTRVYLLGAGTLCFLPGAWATRLVYLSARRRSGHLLHAASALSS